MIDQVIVSYPKTGLPSGQTWQGDFLLKDGHLTHIATPEQETTLLAAGAVPVRVSYDQFVALGGAVSQEHPMLPGGSPLGQLSTAQVSFAGKGTYGSGEAYCREVITAVCDLLKIPTTHWVPGMLTIAFRETSYNSPDWQVNNNDSNNVGAVQSDGSRFQCSRGGWQCIPQTFAQYHRVGTSLRIYDPYANCAASMAYIVSNYGVHWDGSDLTAKVQQSNPNLPPRGY